MTSVLIIFLTVNVIKKANVVIYTFIDKDNCKRIYKEPFKYTFRFSSNGSVLDNDYFLPDFQARYLTEDVPYGLVVTKAIAQLAQVDMPIIDEVILTVSKWIGKEYIKGGYLEGKDINDTRIPQNYGINNLEEIIIY